MNFKKVNNITGWAVFIIAALTYVLTREARGSLWDCGEFVSCAYKQQLPHPPGAPVFVMLGRLFIVLFGNSPLRAANAVNLMSALASAATILFLFWTVTHFARKMLVKAGEEMNAQQVFIAMGAGAVGALIYTFTDSFWYSAVEGEVYALSSFFTALVFWAMLKWEHADEQAGMDETARRRADRWIVFLFFMLGLAIGVHLLGLLTIPAIIMIYYYRRYQVTTKGAIIAFIIGCIVTGIVQVGIIQYSMKSAGLFDVFFVNSLHMPFFSGFTIYFVVLAVVVAWALRFNENKVSKTKLITWFIVFFALFTLPFFTTTGGVAGQVLKFLLIAALGFAAGYFIKTSALKVLKLALWCFAFTTLGYLMYITALIRSNANPSIDMNDVDNPMNLVYYLSREQYGSAPLIYGPHFLAAVDYDAETGDPYEYGEMQYVQDEVKKKYVPIGKDKSVRYKSSDKQLFPRVWDPSNDQSHFDFYISWLNLGTISANTLSIVTGVADDGSTVQTQDQSGKTQNYSIDENYSVRVRRGQVLQPGDLIAVKAPSYGDNLNWFFSYQLGLMYWRYFMWNFSGKQNDVQGLGNRIHGNWITGIPIIDNKRLGDQSQMPDSLNNNKAHNKLYMLPFLLGILGCVYQYFKNRKDWIVTFLLFFLTGIAIVLYLNQPGNQPRERDYAYAGSFYAYAIWAGLGVVAFARLAREKEDKKTFSNVLTYGSILTFLIALMSGAWENLGNTFIASVMITALYAIFAYGLTFLFRAISSSGKNIKLLNIVTTAACLVIPLIMAQQEWDDHDRSTKTLPPDMAKDYLESCAPNAILFTFGDNDTYPLWYAQEVEGVRPDIRIINNSLLGIDWYINQLRSKVNDADSVDVIWTPEQIEGHNREIMYYQADNNISQDTYFPLYDAMKNVLGKPTFDPVTKRDVGPETFPVKRFSIPVDTSFVRKNGTVNPGDSVVSDIKFELGRSSLQRNDLMILNIIAANNWKRPIYFSMPPFGELGSLGFGDYFRKDGLTYRLVPVKMQSPENNWLVRTTYFKDINENFIIDNLMNKFVFASKKGTYFDEENRRHVIDIRSAYAEAAGDLADRGKKDIAKKLLEKCDSMIHESDSPYGLGSRDNQNNINSMLFLEACYKAGDSTLVKKIRADLKKDFEQQKRYYDYLKANRDELYATFEGRGGDADRNEYYLQMLDLLKQKYDPDKQPVQSSTTTINSAKNPDSTKKNDSAKPKK